LFASACQALKGMEKSNAKVNDEI